LQRDFGKGLRPGWVLGKVDDAADNAATIDFTRTEMAGFRAWVYVFKGGFEIGDTQLWSSTNP
jgi:hypothetical protein